MPQAALLKVEVVAACRWNDPVTGREFHEQMTSSFTRTHKMTIIVSKHPFIVSVEAMIFQESLDI